MRWIAVLFLLLSPEAFAKDAPACEAELALEKVVELPPLDDARAEEIIGQADLGRAPVQLRRAVTYLLEHRGAPYSRRIEDLRTLLKAITHAQLFTWKAHQFYGPNGTIGFAGDAGFFIWLTHDGRIYKGLMRLERDLNDYSEWNGNYDSMEEVKPQ